MTELIATKNEGLWLASGQAGENQARALNLPIEFTRLVVGDANGNYPPMDPAITELINELMTADILSHVVDPNDVNQRIFNLSIPPSANLDAVEMMLYAKYGETEFAHTYFRFAAPLPIRTIENGGAQAKFRYTVRVSQHTDFTIFVSPSLSYVTHEELRDSRKPVDVNVAMTAITTDNKLHVFSAPVDLQIPTDDGALFKVMIDDAVVLSDVDKCRLLAPTGKKIYMDGVAYDSINLKVINIIHTVRKTSNGDYKI